MNTLPEHINSGPWMLDPAITYLNHGSFGARTVEVFEAQQAIKRSFESSPVDFLDRRQHLITEARQCICSFVGADADGFGFVENATAGVGAVISSAKLEQGDEILTTSLVYNGVRQLLKHHCKENGLLYREVDILLPVESNDSIVSLIESSMTSKTALLVVDHIASVSAVVFPVKDIIQLCRQKSVLVLVDGAHAPGMVELSINSLQPDWYVANLHKWTCAPIGAAFVWANASHRKSTHPLTISHGLDEGLQKEFDWQGTRDVSAWIAAVDAVKSGAEIGWDTIRAHNHELALWMQDHLLKAWNAESLTPIDGNMLGSMATVYLPENAPNELDSCIALRDEIYEKYALEVPIFPIQGRGALRVSAQLYSSEEDIERLLAAISSIGIFE